VRASPLRLVIITIRSIHARVRLVRLRVVGGVNPNGRKWGGRDHAILPGRSTGPHPRRNSREGRIERAGGFASYPRHKSAGFGSMRKDACRAAQAAAGGAQKAGNAGADSPTGSQLSTRPGTEFSWIRNFQKRSFRAKAPALPRSAFSLLRVVYSCLIQVLDSMLKFGIGST
jgi:hypothetical protein